MPTTIRLPSDDKEMLVPKAPSFMVPTRSVPTAKASRERTARQPAAAAAHAHGRAPSPTLAAFSGKYERQRGGVRTHGSVQPTCMQSIMYIYMKFLRQRENLTRLHAFRTCHSESAPVPVGVAAVSA